MVVRQLTKHSERGGCRGYDSVGERDLDIERLRGEGYDHFVTYCDSDAPIALSYGKRYVDNSVVPESVKRVYSPKPGDRGYDLLC